MATLTETAYFTRMAVKWGAVALGGLMVGRILLGAVVAWWKATHPPPPPPPTVGFGKLPRVVFPTTSQPAVTYTLETVSGTTPSLGDRGKVYFMPVERPNLLALERATEQAANLGFVFQPKKVSDTVYQWTKTQPLPSSLETNIITGNFKLIVNWQTDPSFLQQGGVLPTETQAITEAKSLLRTTKLLSDDLAKGEATITYLKAVGNDYMPTVSLSEADFVQVNMARAAIEEEQYAALAPDPDKGVVQIIFSGWRDPGKRVAALTYNYFPVDYDQFHTYPLKSSLQAWEELIAGQGYIAHVDNDVTQVTVRQVQLAYFDATEAQNYLQPIYVFRGDNNFVGYVSAIAMDWVQ